MMDVKSVITPSVQVRNGGLSLRQKNPPKNSPLASIISGRLLLHEQKNRQFEREKDYDIKIKREQYMDTLRQHNWS